MVDTKVLVETEILSLSKRSPCKELRRVSQGKTTRISLHSLTYVNPLKQRPQRQHVCATNERNSL